MSNETIQLMLRLSPDLRGRLKERADINYLPLATYIRTELSKLVDGKSLVEIPNDSAKAPIRIESKATSYAAPREGFGYIEVSLEQDIFAEMSKLATKINEKKYWDTLKMVKAINGNPDHVD